IPHELDAPDREALVRGFAEAIVERFGVVADVALHAPGKDGDQRNHHAHILTTTRVVEPDGLGAKTRQLDVASTAAAEVSSLRELWAMQCNEALEKNHQKARVEHRSYAAQGIDRVPGVHLGPKATAIERRERKTQGQNYKPRTFKAKQNAAAAERNAVIDAAKKLIDAAEQAITRATSAAKEVVDWFSSLAQSVGSATIEKAQERAKEQEAYRKRLQEIAQRREQDRGRGRGR
ncbi:MobA/MobL family protein, partial [Acetobacter thailandicus]|uniref:MobA/MobL family protein n=1 Tax=Acetobacter thailandicus TaxID=1502842 RepID=UPI001BABE837